MPGAGDDDVRPLRAEAEVGDLPGPQGEPDRAQRAAEHHRPPWPRRRPASGRRPGPPARSRRRTPAGRARRCWRRSRARPGSRRWRRRTPGRTRSSRRTARRCRRRTPGRGRSGPGSAGTRCRGLDPDEDGQDDAGRRRCTAQVPGLSQPQLGACSKPSTRQAHAGDRSARRRRQSIRLPLARRRWMPATSVSTSATTATGMLIQKIARQVHWVRQPPAIGPIAVSPPLTPKKIASARPRSRIGNGGDHDRQRGRDHQRAARRPAATRKTMIQASANDPFGVAPHSAEDAGETDDADQHHPSGPEHVGQPAAQGERRRPAPACRR